MTNSIRIFIILAIAGISFTACKSKQSVTAIPGANVTAKTQTPVQPVNPTTTTSTDQEVTRNETFSAVDGETNTDQLKKKFHVIVGSFSKIENAKGLKTQLQSEGNTALIVINEKGMYRVIIASYDEYSGARGKINQINNRFPDAWCWFKNRYKKNI